MVIEFNSITNGTLSDGELLFVDNLPPHRTVASINSPFAIFTMEIIKLHMQPTALEFTLLSLVFNN